MGSILRVAALLLFLLLTPNMEAAAAQDKTLRVATKSAPPFSFKNSAGDWQGISIDLWRSVAADLELDFEFHETDLEGMLSGIREEKFDLAVAALTVTEEREAYLDFSHPFYTTGLGIAIGGSEGNQWLAVARGFFSLEFLQVIGVLSLVLLIFGLLVWLFERRRNPDQFGQGAAQGIGAGFWWAAVTMTTVGYGDKAPLTLGGRLVALVWMFAAIIIISSFTAAITSSLTVSQLGSSVQGPEDLPRVRVASVADSTSAGYLSANRIAFRALATPAKALAAVAEGSAEAAVYDAPLLKYLANRDFADQVRVLPAIFDRQDYAIALPQNSALREDLNRALLGKIRSPWWRDTLYHYLGE